MIEYNNDGRVIRVTDSNDLDIDCKDVAKILEDLWNDRPIEIEFVPFSRSRNAKEKHKSMNYKVHICGMIIDYSMGIAHCQAYKFKTNDKNVIIKAECENGHPNGVFNNHRYHGKRNTLPRVGDVIHSIVRECEVLDSSGFDDFCFNFGYDTDSRKAFEMWNLMINQSLRFKNSIPSELFESLRIVSRFN